MLLPVALMKTLHGVAPVRDSYGELHSHQMIERAVFLNNQQLSPAKESPETDRVQIGCLLLEDSVPCRYHWPRNVTMRVNTIQYRPYSRNPISKMGINQRDEAANVASFCIAGRNTVEVQGVESGTWVVMLQRTRHRTVSEVKELMASRESVADATARVKRLLHGGHGDEEEEYTSFISSPT